MASRAGFQPKSGTKFFNRATGVGGGAKLSKSARKRANQRRRAELEQQRQRGHKRGDELAASGSVGGHGGSSGPETPGSVGIMTALKHGATPTKEEWLPRR